MKMGRVIKEPLRTIDNLLLGGIAFGFWRWLTSTVYSRRLHKLHSQRFSVSYDPHRVSYLAGLCDLHGSDKGSRNPHLRPYNWKPHNYADFYELTFGPLRSSVRTVVECGIGTNNPSFAFNMGLNGRPGASLRVWADFFPNAEIIGADIDKSVLFETDRIKCYHLDQTDARSIELFWRTNGLHTVDVIIDDGLHEYAAGISLFEGSIDKLSSSGTYIIEDVSTVDLIKYSQYFKDRPYSTFLVALSAPTTGLNDNNLVVIRRLNKAA